MRRNDIVGLKDNGCFYGRVVRIIGDKALWICSGLHIHLTPIDKLEVLDYVGYREWVCDDEGLIRYYDRNENGSIDFKKGPRYSRKPHFVYMTTLRKLKQQTTRFHGRNVWKTPLDYEYLQLED